MDEVDLSLDRSGTYVRAGADYCITRIADWEYGELEGQEVWAEGEKKSG